MNVVKTEITINSTRYTYEASGDTATITAATIDVSATNGGTMTVPIKDADQMWAALRALSAATHRVRDRKL